jgi:alginate O-acetyltransferase complex protein AlgJ
MTFAGPISSAPQGLGTAEPAHSASRYALKRILGMAFIAALFLPMVGTWMKWDLVASSENRALARFPGMPGNFRQARMFSDLFMDFYRDHFGFRNTLIRALARGKYSGGLDVDVRGPVIFGKDHWLFFRSSITGDWLAERDLDPFSESELDAWQELYEKRNKFFAERGIPFLLVIAPDKQSIYPEFLPDQLSRIGPESRLDQFIDRLRKTHSPVHFLDLRPILLEARKQQMIYFRTDDHWNDYGAHAAYLAILKEMQRMLPGRRLIPQPIDNFIPGMAHRPGDLAKYVDLTDEYDEEAPRLVRRVPFPAIFKADAPYAPLMTVGSDPNGPVLYALHDSYTDFLAPFLGPHFSKAYWEWTNYINGAALLKTKPDLVFNEFVERKLNDAIPVDSEEIREQSLP